MVLGCSHGSIADIPLARYVGHGHDPIWSANDVDAFEEPKELQKLPRPRVVYLGTLSMRIDVKAIRALAESGLQVVIIGFGPSQELTNIITEFSNITFLGARSPLDTPRYLLHCDVGIVPHTDEPFTWSMEPHKLYNYASAGLRSVVLNCAVPASLSDLAISTTTNEAFVEHVFEASRLGRLTREQIEKARSLDWRTVSTSILDILGFKTATVQQEELTEIREPTSIRGASEANMAT
jgi:hypothetical protein